MAVAVAMAGKDTEAVVVEVRAAGASVEVGMAVEAKVAMVMMGRVEGPEAWEALLANMDLFLAFEGVLVVVVEDETEEEAVKAEVALVEVEKAVEAWGRVIWEA